MAFPPEDATAPRRGARAAAWLGALLLLAVVVWVVALSRLADEDPATRVPADRRAAPVAPASVEPVAAVHTATSALADTTRYFEVCGFGRRAFEPGEEASAPTEPPAWPQLQAAVADASQRLAQSLQAHDDERHRALGLWLADGFERSLGVTAATPRALSSHRAALVRLALNTRDAQVYERAWSACHRTSGPATPSGADDGCDRLSTAQWARLDPGNATPWLHALQQASARNAAADRMVSTATSTLTFGVGVGIGKRLGWPAQRVQALEQQRREAATLLRAQAPTEFSSCDAVPALRSYFQRVAAVGELGAAREASTAPQ